MYFPESIPNAIDSAVIGDFKDYDGSYSDRVGKIVGGLNPAGDVRDNITIRDIAVHYLSYKSVPSSKYAFIFLALTIIALISGIFGQIIITIIVVSFMYLLKYKVCKAN